VTSWSPEPIFGLIADRGQVSAVEMERTFNLGVGMVAVLPATAAEPSLALLRQRGVSAWVLGEVRHGA
jgi:phosphoribosylformylglycinamidine cyclo-ligase